jgi:predicted patatin/cPLA2 family phospholipase
MDFKLLFEDFPEKIIPYDYDAYFSNPDRFVMVTTNCLTGKAEYLEENSSSARVMDIVRASSSLPFVSPITYVDGVPMLDGGIVDSIPVEYAMSQGYEKLVVVLTRKTPQNWLLYTRKVTILPLIRNKRQYIYRIFLYRHLLWL